MHLISVVLNCGSMFEESASNMEYCFSKYHMSTLLPQYNYIKNIDVLNSDIKSVKTYSQKSFSYPLTDEEESLINIKVNLPNQIEAPLKKEQIVGNIEIYLNNCLLFSENIYTMESVMSNNVIDNFKRILSKW